MRQIKFRAWFCNKMYGLGKNDNFSLRNDGFCAMSSNTTDKEPILMQFTGLKDKNGKDIYEGDIIRNRDGIWKVEYLSEFAEFCMVAGDQIQNLNMCLRSNEIVGNIYENPELLEQSK